MGSLFLQVLPLAIGAAISPTILTVAVLVLSSKKQQVARTLLYLAGCWAILLAIGIPGAIWFANLTPMRKGGNVGAAIDVFFGMILLILGVRRISKKPTVHEQQGSKAGRLTGRGLPVYFGVGLVMMLTNFTTLAIYFPLLKDLARSSLPLPERLGVLVVCQVIILAVIIVPLAIRIVAPRAATKMLGNLSTFVARNSRKMMTIVIFVFAVYLLVKGARVF
jgi:hypothetical protein